MGKDCFTCVNKISEEDASTLRLTFRCKISGNNISQIDPACDHYEPDKDLVEIRMLLAAKARQLRKQLNHLTKRTDEK